MEKFNANSIITGFIKQLLSSYNLPKYKVYTKEHQRYFEKYGKERQDILQTVTKDGATYPSNLHYIPYIKNNEIQEYIDGTWVRVGTRQKGNAHIHGYTEGIKILNYTRNLQIKNNIYDSYTHEYLGDYLRFQRDYNDLDLMPLYNCFSNRACDKLDLSFAFADNKVSFKTADTSYKIYMLPIKLFKKYTIAIDSVSPIEMCCGLYGAYQDMRARFRAIPQETYQRIAVSKFSQPILYTQLYDFCMQSSPNSLTELSQNEDDLKLFIKLPRNNNSTIVILEGDYTGWNDTQNTKTGKSAQNYSVLNFEKLDPEGAPVKLITPLQLLCFNTGEQYPFADRLLEYLSGNAITHLDTLPNNVMRVQKALTYGTKDNLNYTFEAADAGIWDASTRYIFYEYIVNNYNDADFNHDILGYVDKDIEKNYSYINDKKQEVSLLNTELTEEDN